MNRPGKTTTQPFAKRSLGQNFLVDKNYIRRIVDALGDIGSSHIIEIGPGRGALTDSLANSAGFLSAIELDTAFSDALKQKYQGRKSIRIMELDVLEADIEEIAAKGGLDNVKIVANLPYNISTPVLRRLSMYSSSFSAALLMLQKEVVNRISAKAGNRDRGFLTVLTEAYFEAESLFEVPPTAFKPTPKVTSAVVRLTPRTKRTEFNPETLASVVSAGFRQKRKTIANNLKHISGFEDSKAILESLGLDPRIRPEALELEHWILLSKKIPGASAV